MDELDSGREAYAQRAWQVAHGALRRADAAHELAAADLERLATSAYMVGLYDETVRSLERAFRLHAAAGDVRRAARCAFWAWLNLAVRGATGQATGWLSRARRALAGADDCVEHAYLLIPAMLERVDAGDDEAVCATAAEIVAAAARFGEADLLALALHEQGHARIRQGSVGEGLSLLDEAMLAVTAGELSPIVTGLVYCGVISGCQDAFQVSRAREWTTALTRWCEGQPEMVSFTGTCLVHRAEIMQLRGAWPDALEEARRAAERLAADSNRSHALALYRQGEVLRLRGELTAAERAYRDASAQGCVPQPGLALLRLAQGETAVALAAVGRALGETNERLRRAALLPALVEIALAADQPAEAASASRELSAIAADYGSDALDAHAAHGRGAVALAAGAAREALPELRRAAEGWQDIDAPYEWARVRVDLAQACRAAGDEDAALLELEAARAVFVRLGARPDVARADAAAGATAPGAGGLTPRELEVLRLIAGGATNRAIARELVLSPRTVDRHVSNILAKLRVPSRAAATAFAYEHHLV